MSLLVAVVTRRTGVTLTLGSKSHHLVEVRPVGEWLDRSWVEDVIVLDLETGDATATAVERLRLMDAGKPIVVIAADGAPWDLLTTLYPDLFVVPLPITASTLLDTVDRAKAASRTVTVAPPAREIDSPPPPMTVAPEPIAIPVPADQPARAHRGPHREAAGRRRLRPDPLVDVEPASAVATERPSAAPPAPSAAPSPVPAAPSAPLPHQSSDAIGKVRALLLEVGVLPRVADTAGVVLSRATEAAKADAAAVLVPDEGVWRVEAGSGLRPLEERLQIDATHWLVTEIAIGRRGLLIKNTDVARNQLAGAPLASWANLLAVPVAAEAFLVLARERSAFTREELTQVAGAVEGLDAPMNDAIDVRRLARKMIDYLDLVE
jgi:hypothetical protein